MLLPVLNEVDGVVVGLRDQALGFQTFNNMVDGFRVFPLSSELC